MNEAQLIKAIKAHIAKGEQHYISAGLHLAKLKERCPDQATFLALVKDKIGIGKSRTYELLQIADGRKTVEEVRADTDERKQRHLSVRNGQDADDWGEAIRLFKAVCEGEERIERCPHLIADSGFTEDNAPIWICRGCGREFPKNCRHHPAVARVHGPDCPARRDH